MNRQPAIDLFDRIEDWEHEGLITSDQAKLIKRRETGQFVTKPGTRVKIDEILVYLGSLVIFLALVFLVVMNWQQLGSVGRILIVGVTTAVMMGAGWWLLGNGGARRRRGAQALWLGSALLIGLLFLVIFNEFNLIDWQNKGPGDPLVLLSFFLAMLVSGVLFYLLPSLTQGIVIHVWGLALLIAFLAWLDQSFPISNHFIANFRMLIVGMVGGGLWLLFSKWLKVNQARTGLVLIPRLFGTLTILIAALIFAVEEYDAVWQEALSEGLAFLICIAFIIASLKWQSRIFLFSGALFLLLLITYLNFAHFSDTVGMPVTLFVTGIILIALGLGTTRLNKLIRKPAGSTTG